MDLPCLQELELNPEYGTGQASQKESGSDPVLEPNPEYGTCDAPRRNMAIGENGPTYDTVLSFARERLNTLSNLQVRA